MGLLPGSSYCLLERFIILHSGLAHYIVSVFKLSVMINFCVSSNCINIASSILYYVVVSALNSQVIFSISLEMTC